MGSPESTQQLRARLAELIELAAAKDAMKDYNTAADLYSQATELQAELNGEMSVENADVLYAYGRALYDVAVSKSDVLGSKIPGDRAAESKDSTESATLSESTLVNESSLKTVIDKPAIGPELAEEEKAQLHAGKNQQHFQFTGDENFDESDSGEEDEENQVNGEEEDDDFANAFEVLDLARILLLRKLNEVGGNRGDQGISSERPSELKSIKERLADIYDLQAEISLEGERFTDAVSDLRAALTLKEELFSLEDPSVAECHYKLSLALEFSSVTRPNDEDGSSHDEAQVTGGDAVMREEAVKHMEIAIKSCKIRMAQEQQKIDSGEITIEDKVAAAKRRVANVKEIVADMEQRLVDLRHPPVSIKDPSQEANGLDALNGILGQIVGQSPTERKSRLDSAVQNANDLSAFVRRKGPSSGVTSEKRSSDSTTGQESTKRAKIEESPPGS